MSCAVPPRKPPSMRTRHSLRLPTLGCSLLLAVALPSRDAEAVPPGFLDHPIAAGEWNQAVGITFDASGRGYVWADSIDRCNCS